MPFPLAPLFHAQDDKYIGMLGELVQSNKIPSQSKWSVKLVKCFSLFPHLYNQVIQKILHRNAESLKKECASITKKILLSKLVLHFRLCPVGIITTYQTQGEKYKLYFLRYIILSVFKNKELSTYLKKNMKSCYSRPLDIGAGCCTSGTWFSDQPFPLPIFAWENDSFI